MSPSRTSRLKSYTFLDSPCDPDHGSGARVQVDGVSRSYIYTDRFTDTFPASHHDTDICIHPSNYNYRFRSPSYKCHLIQHHPLRIYDICITLYIYYSLFRYRHDCYIIYKCYNAIRLLVRTHVVQNMHHKSYRNIRYSKILCMQ